MTLDLAAKEEREARIYKILNREGSIDTISALIRAYKPEPRPIELSKAAIIIDSSAFLRLASQVHVVDYLQTRHAAPIILPGQTIQEFWNNYLSVTDSISTGINKRFEALKTEVNKVDGSFQEFSGRFTALIGEFRSSYGYAYDGVTVRRTTTLLEVLRDKALMPYVTRERFCDLAIHRKRTKTPPGFKDDGDGDFFVWLDMLDGLLIAKDRGIDYNQVLLITNDVKLDWSREGVAHPLLSAEVAALVGTPFETWDVTKLAQKVAAANE